jgi:hypothetical protein
MLGNPAGAALPIAGQMANLNLPPNPTVAAALPPVAPGMQPALRHKTFATLYHDETKDPLRSRAAAVIQRYDVTADTPQTPEALLESAIGNPSVPGTFLCCAVLNGASKPRIYLLHVLSKYVPAMDGQVTPWDNRIFGFLGEILKDQAMTIAIPLSAFNVVQCAVYEDIRFSAGLININEGDNFPRLNAGAQDAQMIQARHLAYLPTKYAPLLLNNNGYTPKEVWNLLHPIFQAENFLPQATPILNWVKMSAHTTNANNRGSPITTINLIAPFLDEELSVH